MIAQRWVHANSFQLELMYRQPLEHAEDEHLCSALVHMCGEVRFHLLWPVDFTHGYVISLALCPRRRTIIEDDLLPGKPQYCLVCLVSDFVRLPINCYLLSDQEHALHSCDLRLCPVTCDLCKRLCAQPHLHGLTPGANHLCGSVFHMHFPLQISS